MTPLFLTVHHKDTSPLITPFESYILQYFKTDSQLYGNLVDAYDQCPNTHNVIPPILYLIDLLIQTCSTNALLPPVRPQASVKCDKGAEFK